jgi:menaquinone-dependent protoporphyrinogen IX oxidase
MKVLIAYGTTEGQTRKIAEKIENQVRELSHITELANVDHKPIVLMSMTSMRQSL